MKQIEDKIKELYRTKTKFCEANGYKSRDLAAKIRTIKSKIEYLNKFLKPLNLKAQIVATSNESEGKGKENE